MTQSPRFSRALSFALVGLFLTALSRAVAADATPRMFDLPSDTAEHALKQFSEQTKLEVLIGTKVGREVKTNAVKGEMSPRAALDAMLAGTGLVIFQDEKTGGLVVRRENADESKNVNRAIAESSDRPSRRRNVTQNENGEEVVKLDTFEVFGQKTLNMDVQRTRNDAQPYYVVNSDQISQSGARTLEDLLRQAVPMEATYRTNAQALPSIFGTSSAVNLRGLGSNETLVLVDGRRMAGVSVGFINTTGALQPDVNGIPMSMIERVEILPTSASAIYGGAAVGGVVNIILKRNYSGGEISATYSSPLDVDAARKSFSGNYGLTLGQGATQIMLGGEYRSDQPLHLGDRSEIFQRNISRILANSPSFLYSTANPFSGATPNIAAVSGNLVLDNGTPLNSPITSIPQGAVAGADLTSGLVANAGKYNVSLSPGTGIYGEKSPFGATPRNTSFVSTIRHRFSEHLELFGEFSTGTNSSSAVVNPFPTSSVTIPGSAPTNPFQGNVRIKIPSAIEPTITTKSITSRVAAGALVVLPGDWKAEADYTWSRNRFSYLTYATADTAALTLALRDPAFNPFADTIAHPLDFAKYLGTGSFSGSADLEDIMLRVGGPVTKVGGGAIVLNVGMGHRTEGSADGLLNGVFPLTPANNSVRIVFGQSQATDSAFAEARIPIIGQTNRKPGLELLEVQIAGRSEAYTAHNQPAYRYLSPQSLVDLNPPQDIHTTTHYTSTNGTIALKYQPFAGWTLRASYATAFLPPAAVQLLPNPTLNDSFGQTIFDPKTGQTYSGWQYTAGGNPNLKPQTSRATNLGVIWESPASEKMGMRVGLEFYHIVQPDYITTPSFQDFVSDEFLASHITRDSTTGRVTVIDSSPVNATEFKTDGFDFSMDFWRTVFAGRLRLQVLATETRHDLRQLAVGAPYIEYAGFPADGGEAKQKGNATLSWERGRWTLSTSVTCTGSYTQQFAPGSPSAIQNGVNTRFTDAQGSLDVPAQRYFDLFGSYRFGAVTSAQSIAIRRWLNGVTIQVRLINVLNTVPPLDTSANPYFYSPYGDPRLRQLWVSVRKAF